MEVVLSLSQGRTAAAQCGLFTYTSVPVIFEPPCISYRSGSAGFVVTHVSAVRFAALSVEEMNGQGTAVAGCREESAVLSSPVYVTYSVPDTECLLCLFTTSQLSFTVMVDSVGKICQGVA